MLENRLNLHFDWDDNEWAKCYRNSIVEEDPIFDVNVQLVYDANGQLENHSSAGYSSVASIKRVSQSTHTVTPRASKTYKIDFTKIAKSLLFKTFRERKLNILKN